MAITDSLISYWKLEEASGTRNDSHGTNHLTDNNTVTQQTGKLGNCGQFTAANSEHLSINDNTDLSTGDIDFTIAAWVYMDSKPALGAIATKWFGGGVNQTEYTLFYRASTDRFEFYVDADGLPGGEAGVLADNLGSPSLSTWYLVIASHDAVNNVLSISVNNGTANTTSYSGGVFNSTAQFRIGSQEATPSSFFDGRIDSVGFWKKILAAGEMTSLYNGGNGLEYPFSTGAKSLMLMGVG